MTPQPILLSVLAGLTVLFWMVPRLSRPGVFFGVSVRPNFRHTVTAQSCVRWYRGTLLIGALGALGLLSVVPRAAAVASLLPALAAVGAWVVMRRRVLPHAAPPEVRRAALTPREAAVPGGLLVLAGPFMIVAGCALIIVANWNAIPDEIPAQWRAWGSGRLVPKSTAAVFRPLVFTGVLLVAFTTQTLLLIRRTRQIAAAGPSLEAELRFKQRTVLLSIVATYLMAAGPGWFAVRRALGTGGAGVSDASWLGAIVIFAVVSTVWMLRVGQGGQRQVAESLGSPGDATPDAAWIGGLLYFNPSDPTVFVEKRMGVGWSLNMGNVWAWVFLGLALGVPMLVLRLMR